MTGLISDAQSAVFRLYLPAVGVWLSEDPSGLVDGPNMYTYVSNSPTNRVDPLGLQWYRNLLPSCVEKVLADGERISLNGNPRRAHCVTTCRLSSECEGNPLAALEIGILKEVGDTLSCGWSRDRKTCESAFQSSDLWDNFRGAVCSLNKKSCEESCDEVVRFRDSEPGPFSRFGRGK